MNYRSNVMAFLLLLAPLTASAAVRPWLSGSIGGSLFEMSDVNREVGVINAALAGTGLSMNEVNGGMVAGAAFGLDLGAGWSVGIGMDRLSASTEVSDASGSLSYDLPANSVHLLGRYSFTPAAKGTGFAQVAVGRITSAGSVSVNVVGSGSLTGDLDGSGIAMEGAIGGMIWAAPQFGLQASLGYRRAIVEDLTVEGTPVLNADGSRYELDYSGVFVRAGFAVAFTK